LVVVCVAHLVLIAVFVIARHMWWEQDETVYLSQVAAHHPALRFSPPRARGMSVLLYPVAHFTTRLSAVRIYLSVLGTAAMYLGFRPWLRLGFGRLVALAAALFSTLWAATFFGAEAQPNFLVATAALAVTGYTIAATRHDGRRDIVLVIVSGALAALLRPSDATWLAGGLLVALFATGAGVLRRRFVVAGALVGSLVLGWSEWVVEAVVRYGGFLHRLHLANAENTPGLHFSLGAQAAAVNGPTLCRPCDQVISTSHIIWWIAIPPLVALGLITARRTARFTSLVVVTIAGTALLAEYLLTVSYAAPRFLLPGYLLLAIPVASGVVALVRWRPEPRVGRVVAGLVGVVVLMQVVSQTHFLRQIADRYVHNRSRYLVEAKALHRAGVRAPCVIDGSYGSPVAFALRCNDHPTIRQGVLNRLDEGTTVVAFASPDPRAYPTARRVRLAVRGPSGRAVAYILEGAPPPALRH
jgi:hypothetical protein